MESIGRISRKDATFTTTLFASPDELGAWSENDSLHYMPSGECLLLFRQTRDFARIYHVAANDRALFRALQSLDGRFTYVADLVGRADGTATAVCYQRHGFIERASLTRMSKTVERQEAAAQGGDQARFAEINELTAVSDFFDRLLDPLVDQIPQHDDLRLATEKKQLLVVRSNKDLDGVLLFEMTGTTAHLRYWYVAPSMRNQGVGAQLMTKFLNLCRACRRMVLWVASNNIDAIAKYERYGFHLENLVDRIMVHASRSNSVMSSEAPQGRLLAQPASTKGFHER